MLQGRVERGFAHRHAQIGQGFTEGRCGCVMINASAHFLSSFWGGIVIAMRQMYAFYDIVKRYKNR
jgi:hypothetical protein